MIRELGRNRFVDIQADKQAIECRAGLSSVYVSCRILTISALSRRGADTRAICYRLDRWATSGARDWTCLSRKSSATHGAVHAGAVRSVDLAHLPRPEGREDLVGAEACSR